MLSRKTLRLLDAGRRNRNEQINQASKCIQRAQIIFEGHPRTKLLNFCQLEIDTIAAWTNIPEALMCSYANVIKTAGLTRTEWLLSRKEIEQHFGTATRQRDFRPPPGITLKEDTAHA